jgi:hypothetical protein
MDPGWRKPEHEEEGSTPIRRVCQEKGYRASLERNKIYAVLPDPEAQAGGDIRVINESGEDYLLPADYYVAIEAPKAVRGFPSQDFGVAPPRRTKRDALPARYFTRVLLARP